MQIIYINGIKATKKDLVVLKECVSKGLECILEVHYTAKNNIAIVTA